MNFFEKPETIEPSQKAVNQILEYLKKEYYSNVQVQLLEDGGGYLFFDSNLFEMCLSFDDDKLIIKNIVVKEEGAGGGSSIVSKMKEIAERNGFKIIIAEDVSVSAAAFWGKIGFVPDNNSTNSEYRI
jgi:hypothetical protein